MYWTYNTESEFSTVLFIVFVSDLNLNHLLLFIFFLCTTSSFAISFHNQYVVPWSCLNLLWTAHCNFLNTR